MNSTSASNTLIEISNLSLSFPIKRYHGEIDSFRELFISALRSPYDFIKNKSDEKLILKSINFSIRKNDRIGILGINGAGKTTLCRCLAGTLRPTVGEVRRYASIRAIFNSAVGVNPELTGRENAKLLSLLIFPDLTKDQRNSLAEEAILFSELLEYADIPFKFYSKGMQARLCLSLITGHSADVLVLDEALDGADQFFREKLKPRMDRCINNAGATIIVGHNPEELMNISNRIIIIDNHSIIFDGNPKKAVAIYNCLKN